MNVVANRFQVTSSASIDDERFVASAEKMANLLVAMVETAGVSAEHPFHAGHQVGLRRFHNQMEMIIHQAVSVNAPTRLLTCLA